MWGCQVHETQSGDFMATLPATGTWSRGDQRLHSASVTLDRGLYNRAEWRELLGRVRDRTIVWTWNTQPVFAGLLINPGRLNGRTNELQFQYADPSELLDGRWLFGVGTSRGEGGYKPNGKTQLLGLSRRGVVIELARIGYTDASISPAWPIPARIPAREAGPVNETFYHYNFEAIDTLMQDQVTMAGGPDIDLKPEFVGNKIRWEFRVGNPYLTGSPIDINLMAPENAVTDWFYEENGEEKLTGMHGPGMGSDEDMVVGAAFEPVSAGLAKDGIHVDKNDDNVDRRSNSVRGRLDGLKDVVKQWDVTVNARDFNPAVHSLGSIVSLNLRDHAWLPDGWNDTRVIGLSGNDSDEIQLDLETV